MSGPSAAPPPTPPTPPTPIVWLAEPREDAAVAAASWARARGFSLKPPASERTGAPDERADVDEVERGLLRAREALTALDAPQADQALEQAERALARAVALAPRPFLEAELLRAKAARTARLAPRDEARAARLLAEAAAIDGGRAPGVGEARGDPAPRVPFRLELSGTARGRADVFVDGAPRTTVDAPLAPGRHWVLVMARGRALDARAFVVPPTGGSLTLALVDDDACSAEALGAARLEVGDAGPTVRAEGIGCGAWIAAAPGPGPRSVLVARCAGAACATPVLWRTAAPGLFGPPQPPPPPSRLPAWAGWTALGVGAVAATAITVVATGLLDARPATTRFVAGGVRVE